MVRRDKKQLHNAQTLASDEELDKLKDATDEDTIPAAIRKAILLAISSKKTGG